MPPRGNDAWSEAWYFSRTFSAAATLGRAVVVMISFAICGCRSVSDRMIVRRPSASNVSSSRGRDRGLLDIFDRARLLPREGDRRMVVAAALVVIGECDGEMGVMGSGSWPFSLGCTSSSALRLRLKAWELFMTGTAVG